MCHAVGRSGGQARAQLRVVEQACQGRCQGFCVTRRHQQPGLFVDDQFRDTRHRCGDHRQAEAHGLHQHVGDAVTIAVVQDDARQGEHRGRAVQLDHLVLRAGAEQLNALVQSYLRDVATQGLLHLAASDDAQAHIIAPVYQQPAGVDEIGVPLLLHQPPDGEDGRGVTGRAGTGSGAAVGAELVEVDSVIDAVEALRGRRPHEARQILRVVAGTGDDEARRPQPEGEPVRRGGVDVLGMRGDAIGQPREQVDEVGHGGRAVGEVGVQVRDTGLLELPGQPSGTPEVFDRGEALVEGSGAPPLQRVRAHTHVAARAAPHQGQVSAQHGPDGRPSSGEVCHRRTHAGDVGMDHLFTRVHDREQVQVQPLALQLEDLVQDKGLGQPRKAFEQVRDTPAG